jgi:hypothetical protein
MGGQHEAALSFGAVSWTGLLGWAAWMGCLDGLAAGGLRLKWGIVGPLKLVLGPAIVGLKVEPLSEFY